MSLSTRRDTSSRSGFRVRSRLEAAQDGCVVTVLIASHVSSRRRLRYLSLLVNSIAKQTVAPEAVYLSWFATDEALAASVLTLLAHALPRLRFRPLRQPHRLSQYQHLRKALSAYERDRGGGTASPAWLLFSDDDDLWHEDRVKLTRRACMSVLSRSGSTVSALSFGIYAYPHGDSARELESAQHVDRMLEQRSAAIWLGSSEIFQYAVRPEFLAAFLCSESDTVIRHGLCDVRFAQWMRQQHSDGVVDLDQHSLPRACGAAPTAGAEEWLLKHWLYYYRNERQRSAVTYLGDLDDLRAHQAELAESASRGHSRGAARGAPREGPAAAAEDEAAGSGGGYARASMGDAPGTADRSAARRVLAHFGRAPSASQALEEEISLIEALARLRHHAELAVLLCLHCRNAGALARVIAADADAPAGREEGRSALDEHLKLEQARFVDEALERFGHAERRRELPVGTVEQCLA